jgi:NADH-quinone oxidoreductase subunit H
MPDMATIIAVIILIAKVVIVAGILFSLPGPLTWIERKVAGHMQIRMGPMRVGPHGILQPIADTVKMLLKEDIIPERADKLLFVLAPAISMVPLFAVFVAIPFGDTFVIPATLPWIGGLEIDMYVSDMNIGILYVLAISGIASFGIILGGWASNSKYAMLGGLRSAAQMISYEVALSFAAIGVVMLSGSLSLLEIVRAQDGSIFDWNVFYLPVGPVWFFIFFVAGLAEMNRIPFDMPEDEGSLAAGFHVEYSGMRFAFFMLAEYVAMVTIAVLLVLFFFGGWNSPFPTDIFFIWPIFWFVGKVMAFIILFMVIRFTLPRYRYDQLMTIGWKILIPLSIINLLITGLMKIY